MSESPATVQPPAPEPATPKPTSAPPAAPAPAKADATGPAGDAATARARKEAAAYRERLRATETERDRLRGQLTAARRSMLAHHAALKALQDSAIPDALAALTDDDVTGLFNDAGDIDPDAIEALVARIGSERPYMLKSAAPRNDPLAAKVSRLAENPQGSVNPNKGDPLRRALRRA